MTSTVACVLRFSLDGSEDAIIISSDTLVLNPGLTTGSNQQMHDKMKKVERMTIRERLNGKPDKAIAHPGLVSHEGGTKVIINETLEGLKLAYVVLGDKIEGGGQIKKKLDRLKNRPKISAEDIMRELSYGLMDAERNIIGEAGFDNKYRTKMFETIANQAFAHHLVAAIVAIVPIRGGAFYEANPQTRIFYVKPAHGELGAELNFEPAASAANNWIEETSYLMAGIGSGDMKKGFAFTFDLNHWREDGAVNLSQSLAEDMMRVGGKAAYESDENKKAGKKLVDAKSRGVILTVGGRELSFGGFERSWYVSRMLNRWARAVRACIWVLLCGGVRRRSKVAKNDKYEKKIATSDEIASLNSQFSLQSLQDDSDSESDSSLALSSDRSQSPQLNSFLEGG